ncbi:hypothetical protein FBU59_004048, partial [Linderina macrospora]
MSIAQPSMPAGEPQATGGMTTVAGSALYLTNTEAMPTHLSQQHQQQSASRGISEQSSATTMSQRQLQQTFVVEGMRSAAPNSSNPAMLPLRSDSLNNPAYAVGGMSAPVLSTATYQGQQQNPSIGAVTAHLYDPDAASSAASDGAGSDGPSFLGNRPIGSPFIGPTFASPQSQKSVIATTTIQYHTTGPSHSPAKQLPLRPDGSTARPRRSQSFGMIASQGRPTDDEGSSDNATGASASQRGMAERRAGQIKLQGAVDLGAAGSRKSLGPPTAQGIDNRTAMTTESGAFSMYPRTTAARSPPRPDHEGFGYSQRLLDKQVGKYGVPGGMRTVPSYEGTQQGGARWLEDEEPVHVSQPPPQQPFGYSEAQQQKLQPIVQADAMAMMGLGGGPRNRPMVPGQGLVPPSIHTARPDSAAGARGWMQRGGESPASAPLSSADGKDRSHGKSRLKNLFHIGRSSDSAGNKKGGSVADQVARLEGEAVQRPMQPRTGTTGSHGNSSDQSSQRSANTNARSVATAPDDSFRESRVAGTMDGASRIHVTVPPGHLSIVYPDSPMSRADTLAKSSVDSARASTGAITSGHAQLVDPDQAGSLSQPAFHRQQQQQQQQYSGSQHTLQQQMPVGSRWTGGDSQGRGNLHAVPSASTTLHS